MTTPQVQAFVHSSHYSIMIYDIPNLIAFEEITKAVAEVLRDMYVTGCDFPLSAERGCDKCRIEAPATPRESSPA